MHTSLCDHWRIRESSLAPSASLKRKAPNSSRLSHHVFQSQSRSCYVTHCYGHVACPEPTRNARRDRRSANIDADISIPVRDASTRKTRIGNAFWTNVRHEREIAHWVWDTLCTSIGRIGMPCERLNGVTHGGYHVSICYKSSKFTLRDTIVKRVILVRHAKLNYLI